MNNLLSLLSHSDLKHLTPHLKPAHFEQHRVLFEADEDIEHVYFPTGAVVSLDSSLRDVKQDDSNNEVAPSRGGEQIDDVLDGLVGAVVGGFESAVWAMLRVRTVVEAAVGKWSAQPFVEEQK